MPDMTEFDAPSREVCIVKRSTTATPQQAFVLLNDTQFVEAARVLAEKAHAAKAERTRAKRIRFVFCRLTGRVRRKRRNSRRWLSFAKEQSGNFRQRTRAARAN